MGRSRMGRTDRYIIVDIIIILLYIIAFYDILLPIGFYDLADIPIFWLNCMN